LAGLSQRATITFEKSSESSLQWRQLVTLLVPKYFGASGATGSTYWGSPGAWDYWETCLYVGVPGLFALAGALPLLRRNRTVAFFFGVAAFAILYALGDNFVLHSAFFHAVPGFDKFRIPGRMSFLFTFAAALLAGFGLRWLLSNAESPAFKKLVGALAGAALLVWIGAQAGLFQPEGNPQLNAQVHALVVPEALGALMLALAAAAILFLAARKTIPAATAIAAVMLLQAIDINNFGGSQNSGTTNPDAYYARSAELVNVIKRDLETEYFRVNARQGGAIIIDRNQGMVDRIFLMEGYTPLSLQRIYPPAQDWSKLCDLMNARYRVSVDPAARTMGLERATTYLPRAFMVYDARVMHDSLVKPFMEQPAFNPARTVVLEDPPALAATDTAYDAGWTAKIVSYSENAITLDLTTPKTGYLVLSEVWYPGWVATVDGHDTPVQRADWNLRALAVGAGRHSVEVCFAPATFRRGSWISGLTLAACLGALVVVRFRRTTAAAKAAA
jgi:hypothetical protein